MAKHEAHLIAEHQAGIIYSDMENRFSYLYTTDRYNGQDAGEFSILEDILGIEVEDNLLALGESQATGDFASSVLGDSAGGCGERGGGSRRDTVLPPSFLPRLLTNSIYTIFFGIGLCGFGQF